MLGQCRFACAGRAVKQDCAHAGAVVFAGAHMGVHTANPLKLRPKRLGGTHAVEIVGGGAFVAYYGAFSIMGQGYVRPQNALHAGSKAAAWGNCPGLAQGVLYNGHLRRVLHGKGLDRFGGDASFHLQAFHGSEPDAAAICFAQFFKMDAEAEAPTHGMVNFANIVAYPDNPLVGALQKRVEPCLGGRASVHADRCVQQPLGLIHQNKAMLVRSGHAQAGRKGGAPVLRGVVLLAGHSPGLDVQGTGKRMGKAGFAGSRRTVKQNVYRPVASTAQQAQHMFFVIVCNVEFIYRQRFCTNRMAKNFLQRI